MTWTLLQGDCLTELQKLPAASVQTCVTSPPYWNLRDYGVEEQLGLEETPEEYVANITAVFREVRRVLRGDGTLWLNLGDTFSKGKIKHPQDRDMSCSDLHFNNCQSKNRVSTLPPKNLVGIPWRVAFALQADGWILRSDIVWHKTNAMPESTTDRPTRAHEYLFLLTKSHSYYYDNEAIKEPIAGSSVKRLSQDIESQQGSRRGHAGKKTMKAVRFSGNKKNGGTTYSGKEWIPSMAGGAPNIDSRKHAGVNGEPYIKANKRDVWTVATANFSEAHFATFPPKLVEPCILAGCPQGGTVLDPFAGAGTTLLVAEHYGRDSIGIELNPEYCEIIRRRMANRQTTLFEMGCNT